MSASNIVAGRKCIIPARGGSKRIPRKNIRPLAGRPLITWTISTAFACGLFDEVMVSTDDEEIADIAREAGATIPFVRSHVTAGDMATTSDVIREVIASYEARGDALAEYMCCLYPASALLTAEKLRSAFNTLSADASLDCCFSVMSYGHPIERAFRVKDGIVEALFPETQNARTQDLEPKFHDAGQFYWFRTQSFKRCGCMVGPRSAPLVLSHGEAVDLDTEDDWRVLEKLIAGGAGGSRFHES
jgi:pseudaminic acid cytidylyltransferase